MRRAHAFTLVELLVVLAILAVLASVLYPVFASARQAAKQANCVSNFRQVTLAISMYSNDYDERAVLSAILSSDAPDPQKDRTWVQLTLPYTREFGIFKCPSDYSKRPADNASFDESLIQGDSESRYFLASQRSNLGYNYLYFSPLTRGTQGWNAIPRSWSEVAEPSRAYVFMDSVHEVTPSGVPFGGGSYLVVPPCRYGGVSTNSSRFDSFMMPGVGDSQLYKSNRGWMAATTTASAFYGGTWPWHRGKATVAFGDGSVKALPLPQLSRGCDVKANWGGLIFDVAAYGWDFN